MFVNAAAVSWPTGIHTMCDSICVMSCAQEPQDRYRLGRHRSTMLEFLRAWSSFHGWLSPMEGTSPIITCSDWQANAQVRRISEISVCRDELMKLPEEKLSPAAHRAIIECLMIAAPWPK